jgi:dihydroorotate dehydrogenase electron transfer subunit
MSATLATPVELRGEVREHRRLTDFAGVVTFGFAGEIPRFGPGQFLQLRVWDAIDPLLNRPFSILDQGLDAQGSWLSVLYQVEGRGTRLIRECRPGQGATILGPLGRPFALPQRPGPAVIVAGGVGIPPFLLVVRELVAAGREARVLLGARDASRLYLRDELAAAGATVRVATEDGSEGHQGYVTALLEEELARDGPQAVGAVYTCGPEGMLQAVVRIAQAAGVPGQASLERYMACGFGVCFTCVCKLRQADGSFKNKRTCLAGPVIAIEDLPAGEW